MVPCPVRACLECVRAISCNSESLDQQPRRATARLPRRLRSPRDIVVRSAAVARWPPTGLERRASIAVPGGLKLERVAPVGAALGLDPAAPVSPLGPASYFESGR